MGLFGGGNRSSDYAGRCGNCHEYMQEMDKYCRFCGTKRGKGAFEPYDDEQYCIYGPRPVKRDHKCPQCSYTWTNCVIVDNEKYCPECGAGIVIDNYEFR